MYDTILLPTDGHPRTPQAVDHALNVADLADATIHVVSVVTPEVTEEEAQAAVDAADEMAADRGIPTQTALLEGRPYEEILEYVERVAVDMIVMGTQGRSGLDRFMLGSVTERVLRTSDVPVLAVRLDDEGAITDADSAVETAREALSAEGHTVADVPEQPYREANTWIVRAETEDGATFNVHVSVGDGETRLARIDS
jgi:nucleotide-binding universal stress UspA family protein